MLFPAAARIQTTLAMGSLGGSSLLLSSSFWMVCNHCNSHQNDNTINIYESLTNFVYKKLFTLECFSIDPPESTFLVFPEQQQCHTLTEAYHCHMDVILHFRTSIIPLLHIPSSSSWFPGGLSPASPSSSSSSPYPSPSASASR